MINALPSAVPVKVVKLRSEPQQPSSSVHSLASSFVESFQHARHSLCLLNVLLNISFYTHKLIGQSYYLYFIDDKY